MGEALKQAITDARANYEIGYYAEPLKTDGKHHKFRVICAHKEVRLQTIPGFYAMFGPDQPAEAERNRKSCSPRTARSTRRRLGSARVFRRIREPPGKVRLRGAYRSGGFVAPAGGRSSNGKTFAVVCGVWGRWVGADEYYSDRCESDAGAV